MAYIRNADWKDDEKLKESLEGCSRQGLQRQEIISFMKKDFSLMLGLCERNIEYAVGNNNEYTIGIFVDLLYSF